MRDPDMFILLSDLTVYYKCIYLPKQNCTHCITYLSIRKYLTFPLLLELSLL